MSWNKIDVDSSFFQEINCILHFSSFVRKTSGTFVPFPALLSHVSNSPFLGELTFSHLLTFAKLITSNLDLQTLGLHVLKIEHFTVDAARTDNKRIQEAAYDVLNTWRRKQSTGYEAYQTLCAGLLDLGWYHLATELQQLVEGSSTPSASPSIPRLSPRKCLQIAHKQTIPSPEKTHRMHHSLDTQSNAQRPTGMTPRPIETLNTLALESNVCRNIWYQRGCLASVCLVPWGNLMHLVLLATTKDTSGLRGSVNQNCEIADLFFFSCKHHQKSLPQMTFVMWKIRTSDWLVQIFRTATVWWMSWFEPFLVLLWPLDQDPEGKGISHCFVSGLERIQSLLREFFLRSEFGRLHVDWETDRDPFYSPHLTAIYTPLELTGTHAGATTNPKWTIHDSSQLLNGRPLKKEGPLRILVSGQFSCGKKVHLSGSNLSQEERFSVSTQFPPHQSGSQKRLPHQWQNF